MKKNKYHVMPLVQLERGINISRLRVRLNSLRYVIIVVICGIVSACLLRAELADPPEPPDIDEVSFYAFYQEENAKYSQVYPLTFEKLKKKAEDGNSYAQYALALRYYWGEGTKANTEQGTYWMQKSAENGLYIAQSLIAKMYLLGEYGKNINYAEALNWASKAAMQHYSEGMSTIGYLYLRGYGLKQDFKKARHWLIRGAELGSCEAMTNLTAMYFNGEGMEKDLEQAFKFASIAAALGDMEMQYITGRMYDDGTGGIQDYAKAYEWLSKAAKQGHASAQYQLSVAYVNGRGVVKDEIEGVAWTLISAENGNKEANETITKLQKGFEPDKWLKIQERSKELKRMIMPPKKGMEMGRPANLGMNLTRQPLATNVPDNGISAMPI